MIFNYSHSMNYIYTEEGKRETIEKLLDEANSIIKNRSLSNEWSYLVEGNKYSIKRTETIEFTTDIKYHNKKMLHILYLSATTDH